jgi:hypothetical protein
VGASVTARRVELYEGCVIRIIEEPDVPGARNVAEITLTAAPATQLFDFLLLYEEQLVRWRDGHTP